MGHSIRGSVGDTGRDALGAAGESMTGGVILGVAAVLVGVCLVWRVAALPCPWWLVPLLENPYFERVAGAEELLDRAGVEPGMTVLDAGCGPGRVTVPAARRVGEGGRVVAVDLQPRMLRRLERRLDDRGLANVETVHGALGEGCVPLGGYDVALLVTVLGEIPDKAAALNELRDSLAAGGVLSVTEVLPDPHYQPLARVRGLARGAGLREARLFSGRVGYTINLVEDAARPEPTP